MKYWLLICFLLSNILNAFAADSPILRSDHLTQFKILNVSDGLSDNHILDIVQDQQNVIWIATINGLNRFNGQKIRSYQYNQSLINSLPSGIVSCLEVDNDGKLWIGTQNGLCVYDSDIDGFQKIDLSYKNLDVSYIRAIHNEGDSIIWIDVVSGYLLKYHKKKERVIESWEHHSLWQPYYYYHDIYRDKRNVLWIASRNIRPLYLDEETNSVQNLKYDVKSEFVQSDDASCIFEDSHGHFWFAGLIGTYNLDLSKQSFTPLLDINTFTIIETKDRHVWFGTSKGIYIRSCIFI